MSSFLHKILITILACFIFSIVLLTFASYKIYENEKERIHLNKKTINLLNKDKSNINLLSESKINEIQLSKINKTSISESSNISNDEEIKKLERKMHMEKYFILNIKKNWSKPFNYKKGESCLIDIYHRKNKIRYNISECTNNDNILKRSFEVSLLEVIEGLDPKNFKIYDYKNKIHIEIN